MFNFAKSIIYRYVNYLLEDNMRNEIRKALQEEAGQGMTEYIIIVALIAIAAIGVVTLFGEQIRDLFGQSAAALSGSTDAARSVTKSESYTLSTKGLDRTAESNAGGTNW